MEFMHFLCSEEAKSRNQGNQEQTQQYHGVERDFLHDHLAPWIADFADCVITITNSQFYKDAANLLKEFVESEVDYFSEGVAE
jgi:TorA maturation chaperone TorD